MKHVFIERQIHCMKPDNSLVFTGAFLQNVKVVITLVMLWID